MIYSCRRENQGRRNCETCGQSCPKYSARKIYSRDNSQSLALLCTLCWQMGLWYARLVHNCGRGFPLVFGTYWNLMASNWAGNENVVLRCWRDENPIDVLFHCLLRVPWTPWDPRPEFTKAAINENKGNHSRKYTTQRTRNNLFQNLPLFSSPIV